MRRWRFVILTSLVLLALAAAVPLGLHVHDVGASSGSGPALGDRYVERTLPDRGATLDMLFIPGGTFTMGSPDGERWREADEGPRHAVRVEPFWMSRTEVTADWVVLWLAETRNVQYSRGRTTPAARRAVAAAPAGQPYGPPHDGDPRPTRSRR